MIAIRQYGRGEVVYLGFDETWRLRRAHGEELYRRFWKEVMWRLALNHALGANKRFVVHTDQQRYPVDQTVTVTVAAGDAQYKALSENEVPGGKLSGQWILPAAESQKPVAQPLTLTQVQPGLFVTRFVVTAPGENRVRVTDPITNKPVEWTFTAFSTSVERQTPIRNSALQEAIAAESGGQSCDSEGRSRSSWRFHTRTAPRRAWRWSHWSIPGPVSWRSPRSCWLNGSCGKGLACHEIPE